MNNLTRKGAVHDILLGYLRHKVRGISLAQDTVHVPVVLPLLTAINGIKTELEQLKVLIIIN